LFEFEYKGGAHKTSEHVNEKFMLFFIIGGKEVPIYQMMREGLVVKPEWNKDVYQTEFRYAKLFVSQKGFGIPSRYYPFYIKMYSESTPYPLVTVKPFSVDKTGFIFRAKCSFLQKDVVLEILEENNPSRKFLEMQEFLPLDTIRQMITVDRSQLKKNVRGVRI
jgi:hypothetical protein